VPHQKSEVLLSMKSHIFCFAVKLLATDVTPKMLKLNKNQQAKTINHAGLFVKIYIFHIIPTANKVLTFS